MTCPKQKLLALHTSTLEQAEAEIAARKGLPEHIPATDSEAFFLKQPLPSKDVAIPRIVGLSALGRPGASGEIFAMGEHHVVIDGSSLTDIDLRLWVAVIKMAVECKSSVVETDLRELARACGDSWGGETGKRIWVSLDRLSSIQVRVWRGKRPVFIGVLFGSVWDRESGGIRVRLIQETLALLDGFGRLEAAVWGTLGAPGRKIGAWIVCQRNVGNLGRESWVGLLDWKGRPTKDAQRDLRAIMARIEAIGLVKDWELTRKGILKIWRPK